MRLAAKSPASLVPTLADAVNKRIRHNPADLQPGDQLHLTAPILGFTRGRSLAVYGYVLHTDEQGQVYLIRAYVRPDELNDFVVPFSERDARKFPAANQREVWFGERLMYLTEICLTDYADCLRLERLSERVVPLLPSATIAAAEWRQAA